MLGVPVGKETAIEIGLPPVYAKKFKENNLEYSDLSVDETADFIVNNLIQFLRVYNYSAKVVLSGLSDVVEKEHYQIFLDENLNDVVGSLSKKSLIIKDFRKAVDLFTATEKKRKGFISSELQAFMWSLDDLVNRKNRFMIDYLFKRDFLHDRPNSAELLRYYSREEVRASSLRRRYKSKLKHISSYEELEAFYRDAVEHFKNVIISQQIELLQKIDKNNVLKRPLKTAENGELGRDNGGERIVPKNFEDLFYPQYKKKVNRFVEILEIYGRSKLESMAGTQRVGKNFL